jgi:toxin HigB-1
MIIRSVKHKGLRRFIEFDDTSGLQAQYVEKIRNIVAFLQDMQQERELETLAVWKAHKLSGDRAATWSLFVSKNWRMTFRIDQTEIEIIELNYEDYH